MTRLIGQPVLPSIGAKPHHAHTYGGGPIVAPVVPVAAPSPPPAPSAPGYATVAPPTQAPPSGPGALPYTGLDVLLLVLVAVGAILAGALLRRAAS